MGFQFASKIKRPAQQESFPPPKKTLRSPTPAHSILQLQRTIGNHRVLRLVESGQLGVSQPGDEHEQEADRVADHVMRMPDSQVQRQKEGEGSNSDQSQTRDEPAGGASSGEGQPLPEHVRRGWAGSKLAKAATQMAYDYFVTPLGREEWVAFEETQVETQRPENAP